MQPVARGITLWVYDLGVEAAVGSVQQPRPGQPLPSYGGRPAPTARKETRGGLSLMAHRLGRRQR